jgi:hypothetical protein
MPPFAAEPKPHSCLEVEAVDRDDASAAVCDVVTWCYGSKMCDGGIIGNQARPPHHVFPTDHPGWLSGYWRGKKAAGVDVRGRVDAMLRTVAVQHGIALEAGRVTAPWWTRVWQAGGQARYEFVNVAVSNVLYNR